MHSKWVLMFVLVMLAVPVYAVDLTVGAPKANPAAAGLTVLVHDREMFANDTANNANWECYTNPFGDGTLALATNTEAEEGAGTERGVLAFFNADGSVVETNGFYTDAGNPWTVNNDNARVDGNPPRIAADKRPGGTKYVFGNECTPYSYPDLFPSYVANGFTYSVQVASVQLLNKVGNTPTPIGKVLDPINGKLTTGAQDNQMRFGGHICALSNGNFVVVVDDRDSNFSGVQAVPFSIIDQNTGLVTFGPVDSNVNPTTPGSNSGIWANVAAFNGGFAVRVTSNSNYIYFFDNNGTALGSWDYATLIRTDSTTPLAPANGMNTSISVTGSSNCRLNSDINSNFIYLAGPGVGPDEGGSTGVYVTKINAQTRQTVGEVLVNDTFTAMPDRVEVCSDKNDNFFVCWSDKANTGLNQIVGRAYDSNMQPLTDGFLCYENSEIGPDAPVGFGVKHPSCSMVDYRVLVTGRFDSTVESMDLTVNDHLAVVFQLPSPASVDGWTQY